MSVTLHTPDMVVSMRHAPSWMLLAMAAGSVNAGAVLVCQRFVSHVTGTATIIGLDSGKGWLLLDYLLILVCFIVGAMSSVLAIGARDHRGKRPLHILPLLVVSALVAFVAVAGQRGVFGPFGGQVEERGDFLLLSILSFAMGLQNATVATSTNMAVRTTHMTGPATDFGVHLATSFIAHGAERRNALKGAALRGAKIVFFILGGLLMLPLTKQAHFLAFLLPAGLTLGATALSFVPGWLHRPVPRFGIPSTT